jgi:acid phosphatase
MRFSTLAVATLATVVAAHPPPPPPPTTPMATALDPADIFAAQATALTESPTSKVKGKVFDRYISIVRSLKSSRLGCSH